MGKKHFTEEQIAFALRQAESGTSVAEVIRKLGISEQTFYRWKKRFAGLGFARSSFHYKSRRNQRAELRVRLRDLAASRVHYGYQRLWILLRREGWVVNKKLDFSRPGKPTDNAVIESFNGRLRDECLNQHWFLSLDEARAVTEAWKEDCNRVRPHGVLGNRAPSEFARPFSGHAQRTALHG